MSVVELGASARPLIASISKRSGSLVTASVVQCFPPLSRGHTRYLVLPTGALTGSGSM